MNAFRGFLMWVEAADEDEDEEDLALLEPDLDLFSMLLLIPPPPAVATMPLLLVWKSFGEYPPGGEVAAVERRPPYRPGKEL